MQSLLIAGYGYVGQKLAEQALAAGMRVYALKRSAAGLPAGCTWIQADLTDPSTLANLPSVDLVAYTTAAAGSTEEAFTKAYVEGVVNLLAALKRQAKTPRVLFTSSTGVFHQDDGSWVDERSPTLPSHFSGTLMLDGEAAILSFAADAVVLRLGGIYGPTRTRLIDQVRSGAAVCDDQVIDYTNRIHRDDCAGAALHLLTLPAARLDAGRIYIGCDRDPVDRNTLYRWLAAQLGLPPPATKSAPLAAVPARNKRCRSDLLVASGYEFAFPTYRQGFGALLQAAQ